MPQAGRINDVNEKGGAAQGGASSVIINGRNASCVGDSVTPHAKRHKKKPHCCATVASGSSRVIVEGRKLTYVGANDSCGHSRVTGSDDVIVGT